MPLDSNAGLVAGGLAPACFAIKCRSRQLHTIHNPEVIGQDNTTL